MPSVEFDLFRPETVLQYEELDRLLLNFAERSEDLWIEAMRWLTMYDLYFFVTRVGMTKGLRSKVTGEPIFERPFILDRCREIEFDEEAPDVWGRGMGKSTIKTRYRKIQRRLRDPEGSGCIFSFERKAAKRHLRAIDEELTKNRMLHRLFPDVLYEKPKDPHSGSPIWNMDEGLVLKRNSSRIEASFEAHTLANLPTGAHFDDIDWDDIETDESVRTSDSIEALKRRFRQSGNLKSKRTKFIRSVTGTFYHPDGVMAEQVRKFGDRARVWPGEDTSRPGNGPLGGSPIFYTKSELWEWWRELDGSKDPRIYAMQIACDYRIAESNRLNPKLIRYYDLDPIEQGRAAFVYICVDAASGAKDATVIWVWGTTQDRKFLWLDCFRQRCGPSERLEAIYSVASKWLNISLDVVEIRIEQFGAAEYIGPTAEYLAHRNIHIPVVACHDSSRSKKERIFERWEPPLAEGRILFPRSLMVRDESNNRYDAVRYFIDYEFAEMPRPMTDDMLDASSLIWESEEKLGPLHYPTGSEISGRKPDDEEYDDMGQAGTFASMGIL